MGTAILKNHPSIKSKKIKHQGKTSFYLKLLRPHQWKGHFLDVVLGFFVAKGYLFSAGDISLLFLIALLFFAFGFTINNCFDTKEDAININRQNPVANKELTFRESFILSVGLGVLAVALSATFSLKVFILALAGFGLGYFYSAPPFRLKSRPILDLVSHGLFAGLFLFALPLLAFQVELTIFHYLIGLSIFYVSVVLELRNHLEDYEYDKAAGLRTTVCVLGRARSKKLLWYLMAFYPLTLFAVFLLISPGYLLLLLILTAAFIFFIFFKSTAKIVTSYRIMDVYSITSFILLGLSTL